MINKGIIKAVLKSATTESKNLVIDELLNHISLTYDYNDNKAGHILELLCDSNNIITRNNVNLDYINKHLNLITYNHEKYNIRNIKVDNIDNIDCVIKISYEYIEKINEDRDDITYTPSYANINFIDNPDILKK